MTNEPMDKISNPYVIALLEQIAYSVAHTHLEKDEYLRTVLPDFHASRKQSPTEVHGNVRPHRPSTREMPKPKGSKGIRPWISRGSTRPQGDPEAA